MFTRGWVTWVTWVACLFKAFVLTAMSVSATFRNLALSTTFDKDEEKSQLSLNWILQSGVRAVRSVALGILTIPAADSTFSVEMELSIASSLTFDLVLNHDWLQYCRESVPETCFYLSSGPVDLRRISIHKLLCTSFAISEWSLSVSPHHQLPLKNPRRSILRPRLTQRPRLNMVRFSTTIKYTSDALPQMCRSTVPAQSLVSVRITLVPVHLHPMSP